MRSELVGLASRVLQDPRPVGSRSRGELFAGRWQSQPAFLRWYVDAPQQASLELAVRRRVAGLVPLAPVLAAHLRTDEALPPHLVTARVLGEPADRLLDGGLAPVAASALGRQCARLVLCLRGVRVQGHGRWLDSDLRVGRWTTARRTLEGWYDLHESGLAAAGLGRRRAPWLRPFVRATADRLATAAAPAACLVHGDLQPASLLVDPSTGTLRALLDWERSHGGDWAYDTGRLLRSADLGAAAGGRGAPSWTAFRRSLVEALHGGLNEAGAGGVGGVDGWLQRAQDLDLFALLELAAQPAVDRSAEVLGARATLLARGYGGGR